MSILRGTSKMSVHFVALDLSRMGLDDNRFCIIRCLTMRRIFILAAAQWK